jgi:hypothetical protein
MPKYALYKLPAEHSDIATRYGVFLTTSAKQAREERKRLVESGVSVGIASIEEGHVPDTLPHGSTLWLEIQRTA